MKSILLIILVLTTFSSCKTSVYGKYNTNHSTDKSSFFQIVLNTNNTVEKTEIHTISDFSKGIFKKVGNKIICYFDTSINNFPPDTLLFQIKNDKLYLIRKKMINKKFYLKKVNTK